MRALLVFWAALMLSAFSPAPPYVVPTTMIDVIKHLGIESGLKLVLDAGDSASYTSGQKWLDRSGGGYDFFLGQDVAATASDPTFNGAVGRQSSAEFFSLDGADWFTYDAAHEPWMQNIHKDGAKFTIAMWIKDIGTSGVGWLLSDTKPTADSNFAFAPTASGKISFGVQNAAWAAVMLAATDANVADGAWMFAAVSIDEATAAGTIQLRDVQKTFNSTYSSPGGDNSGAILQIGAGGTDGFEPLASGSKIAAVMIWESVSLTDAQLTSLYNATKTKFGL